MQHSLLRFFLHKPLLNCTCGRKIHASIASHSGRQLEVRLNEAKTRPQEHTHLIQQPTHLNLWLQVTQLQSTVIPWHRRNRRPGRFKGCRLWVNWWPKVKFRRQLGNARSSKPAWHRGEPRSLVGKTACCYAKGPTKDTWIWIIWIYLGQEGASTHSHSQDLKRHLSDVAESWSTWCICMCMLHSDKHW